ncbi:MAG: primosomal protein N', partial [Acidobacteriota bacterium]
MSAASLPSPRPDEDPEYCDVSLPVPMDQAFTYRLPLTLRHRVAVGCRVLVPFGSRQLAGVVIAAHNRPPSGQIREALQLLDEEPALDEGLLKLGRWIASYYCASLGETLRAMTPLANDVRRTKTYSLTTSGRDAAKQLHLGAEDTVDPTLTILRLLETRSRTASYLTQKVKRATTVLRGLEKKGFVTSEDVAEARDPLRASAARLRVEFGARTTDKLPKAERELLAYLELHPGQHNLATLEDTLSKASPAARSLARRNLVTLSLEPVAATLTPKREPHALNTHQKAAFEAIADGIRSRLFRAFLLEGVTGSGKTEVYLNAIDAALAAGRGALLLVPEIALTPAVAGQFHHRFGDKVAILHSAFLDAERAQEWRRIRSGEASVVIATRSGVFAPVQNLGLIIVDEEHDPSYKQQEAPRYNGRDVAAVRARNENAVIVLGSATPSLESRFNTERGKYTRLPLPERIERRPMPQVQLIDMRQEFLESRKQATFSRALIDAVTERLANGEQTMLML